jgi:hypothetical protein
MVRAIVTAILASATLGGCLDTDAEENSADETITTTCSEAVGTYTPFVASGSPSGTVAQFPWRGVSSSYPNGDEAFAGYGTPLPVTVECSNGKSARDYLDVTAGCLSAVAIGSYTRGQIHAEADDAFRMVALGHTGTSPPVKWTDAGVEYRFHYAQQIGTANNPGFKAFLRYRTEDDLYVASWRTDGVAQIQKKKCGIYTPLAVAPSYGAPTANAWHTIRFTVVGDTLTLILDGKTAVTAHDSSFSWGTAGVRIDAMDGAYLDDWRVFAP